MKSKDQSRLKGRGWDIGLSSLRWEELKKKLEPFENQHYVGVPRLCPNGMSCGMGPQSLWDQKDLRTKTKPCI